MDSFYWGTILRALIIDLFLLIVPIQALLRQSTLMLVFATLIIFDSIIIFRLALTEKILSFILFWCTSNLAIFLSSDGFDLA